MYYFDTVECQVRTYTAGEEIPYNSEGMTATFTMPADDVNLNVEIYKRNIYYYEAGEVHQLNEPYTTVTAETTQWGNGWYVVKDNVTIDQRIEVHGSLGSVAAENQRPVSIEVATKDGYTRPALHDFFMTRYTEAYAAEIRAFLYVICVMTHGLV